MDQKEMVTRALTTWVISGGRKMCKNAIALQMARTIGRMERIAHKELEKRVLSDFVARVTYLKPEFFDLAYYPIGGMSTLTSMSSTKKHKEVLVERSHDIEAFIELMRIFHFWHTDLAASDKFAKPSLNKGVGLIDDVKKWGNHPAYSISKLRSDLRRYMERASLLYAASTLQISEGQTLLEAMRRHELTFTLL